MKDTINRCVGLVRQYNPLSVAPGALTKADDCVIRQENVVEDRRGYKIQDTLANNIKQIFAFNNRVLAHHSNKIAYDDGTGDFSSDYAGAYTEPDNSRIRGIEAKSNFYFTTNEGVKVFEDFGSEARGAGAPRCLDPSYVLTSIGAGFLQNGFQCAYRALIKRTDTNKNVLFGYPSQRLWVINDSGSDENVTLTLFLPSSAKEGDEIQFYRTDQISGTSTDTSGDEMGLVYQQTLSSSDITSGQISFTDSVTDTLIGASLYTNPSQEGIRQANLIPPLCKDLALYKSDYMFFANTKTKQRLSFTVVGATKLGDEQNGDTTSGSAVITNLTDTSNFEAGMLVFGSGIPAGAVILSVDSSTQVTLDQNATATASGVAITFITHRTMTIGGVTYSFSNTEDIANRKVEVGVTGVAAADIDSTARSMVRVINRTSTNTSVYAYYLSGPDDLPGQILLEEQGIGASAFTIMVSNSQISSQFFPAAPVSPSTTTAMTSTNQVQKNALYYSKTDQVEAVPALNFVPVGPANREILRIAELKDALIIIKEEGVYRLTGETPSSFVVTPLDLTVFCKAANSVAVLGNKVYMLSNQGVVSISENAVEVVSRDIEPLLIPLLQNSSLASYSFGLGYESERFYMLSTISDSGDSAANQVLIYNYFTRTWTRWTFGFAAGVVEPTSDLLYFIKPSDDDINLERKSFSSDDFADPEKAVTITDIAGSVVTLDNTVTPKVGDAIKIGTTAIAIESIVVNPSSFSCTMKEEPPATWSAGAATLFPSVGMSVEYNQWSYQQPGTMKQVREVGVLTNDIGVNNTATRLSVSFKSNFDADPESINLIQPGEGWGAAWGTSPWGGEGDTFGYPTYVPKNKQYCTRLYVGIQHNNALEKLSVCGLAFEFDLVSEEIGR